MSFVAGVERSLNLCCQTSGLCPLRHLRLKWFRSLQRPAWCRMDTTCSTEWSKFHWTVRWWHKELWMQCSWGHRCMAQARVCSCISIWPPDSVHLKSMPQNPVFECMQYESISYPSYANTLCCIIFIHQAAQSAGRETSTSSLTASSSRADMFCSTGGQTEADGPWVRTWQDWLKEKQPWCISRRLFHLFRRFSECVLCCQLE